MMKISGRSTTRSGMFVTLVMVAILSLVSGHAHHEDHRKAQVSEAPDFDGSLDTTIAAAQRVAALDDHQHHEDHRKAQVIEAPDFDGSLDTIIAAAQRVAALDDHQHHKDHRKVQVSEAPDFDGSLDSIIAAAEQVAALDDAALVPVVINQEDTTLKCSAGNVDVEMEVDYTYSMVAMEGYSLDTVQSNFVTALNKYLAFHLLDCDSPAGTRKLVRTNRRSLHKRELRGTLAVTVDTKLGAVNSTSLCIHPDKGEQSCRVVDGSSFLGLVGKSINLDASRAIIQSTVQDFTRQAQSIVMGLASATYLGPDTRFVPNGFNFDQTDSPTPRAQIVSTLSTNAVALISCASAICVIALGIAFYLKRGPSANESCESMLSKDHAKAREIQNISTLEDCSIYDEYLAEVYDDGSDEYYGSADDDHVHREADNWPESSNVGSMLPAAYQLGDSQFTSSILEDSMSVIIESDSESLSSSMANSIIVSDGFLTETEDESSVDYPDTNISNILGANSILGARRREGEEEDDLEKSTMSETEGAYDFRQLEMSF